ncbi:uncharacterized protein KY384_004284 [Bacidia gigantensis]|uniref:uncharacterized protein n=1 Tax=Bacidia gigantensis TaxID=2732470 RepID=UPI001D04C557|nr:uncharacterized protein KY384_004284 [Bacidia gigantensis]KAG8530927.1 hypothetical protein KY384_004284 [Bacidia gigantensis]
MLLHRINGDGSNTQGSVVPIWGGLHPRRTALAFEECPQRLMARKKPGVGQQIPTGEGGRGGTNASGLNSPNLVSSPLIGTFTTSAKDRQGRSPAPSLLQRVPSSRARQSSTQGVQMSRNRSSSTLNQRTTNGNGPQKAAADVEKVSGLTGKSAGEVRNHMKETLNSRGEHMIEDTIGEGSGDMRGALVIDGNRERSNNGSRTRDRPPSISTRGGGGGNSKNPSKTATPLTASFNAEPPRSRPPRGEVPAKRSHKKGAGLAAQRAVAVTHAATDADGSSMQGNEDGEDGEGGGEDEPRYCICEDYSYGEMVGCDNDDCAREWFHLKCVGLSKAPPKTSESRGIFLRCENADA